MKLRDVLQDRDALSKASNILTWVSAVLGGITALAAVLALLEVHPRLTNWIAAVCALVAAFAGAMVLLANNRHERLEHEFKRTMPVVDVHLKTLQETEKPVILIEPQNDIPFECQWMIVTKKDSIISGLMLEWVKIYPKTDGKNVAYFPDLSMGYVIDSFVELRFEYRSLYYAEFRDLKLESRLVKSYVVCTDNKYFLPTPMAEAARKQLRTT